MIASRTRFAALIVAASASLHPASSSSGTLKSSVTPLGGWSQLPTHHDEIPESAHRQLREEIDEAISRQRPLLKRLAKSAKADVAVRFSWPVRAAAGRPEFATHAISGYLDHNPATGQIQDFNCGTRSYDLESGYRHTGTDIFIPPMAWKKMDGEESLVVAAAPGEIIVKTDGNADRTCGNLTSLPAGLPANRVVVLHDDGTRSIYIHMKSGTLTPKTVGQRVEEGEYLGTVGSSGFSSGPHLHFEVHDSAGNVVDPWLGACNPDVTQSLWKSQEPYINPGIMDLMVARTSPQSALTTAPCNNNVADVVPLSSYYQPNWHYAPGDAAYFTAWLRDLQNGAAITFRILRPDGSVFDTQTFTADISSPLFAAAYYFRGPVTLPAAGPTGQWRFEAVFGAQTRSVPFHVGVATPTLLMMEDFYHPTLNHYFRTPYPEEAAIVRSGGAGPGWQDLNDRYSVLPIGATTPGALPVCRFYGSVVPGPNSHFYTASQAECDFLKALQHSTPASQPRWNFEGIAFSSFMPDGGICPRSAPYPIYRLYNNRAAQIDSNHRFTSLTSLVYKQAALGWSLEGVVMCAVSKP
jgi:murein DD-endopeptidase MepM/ murein hydrolase activator NlpD